MRNLRLTLAGLVTLATHRHRVALHGRLRHAAATPSLPRARPRSAPHEYTKGKLTVATDTPAYTPWFVNNTPSNGKGYESAVAYAIAKELGVKKSNVVWVHEPFNASFEPGTKHFDFDINEISYTSARAQGRHLLQQLLRRPAVDHRAEGQQDREEPHRRPNSRPTSTATRSARRDSPTSISKIKPTKAPRVYNSLADAALGAGDASNRRHRPRHARTVSTWRRRDRAKSSTRRNRTSRSRSVSSRASASTTASSSRRATSWSVA